MIFVADYLMKTFVLMPPCGVLIAVRSYSPGDNPPAWCWSMGGKVEVIIPDMGSMAGVNIPVMGSVAMVQCMAPWVQQWLGIGAMPAMDGSIIVPDPAARFIRSMLEPPMGGIIPGCITPAWVMPLKRFEIKHLQ